MRSLDSGVVSDPLSEEAGTSVDGWERGVASGNSPGSDSSNCPAISNLALKGATTVSVAGSGKTIGLVVDADVHTADWGAWPSLEALLGGQYINLSLKEDVRGEKTEIIDTPASDHTLETGVFLIVISGEGGELDVGVGQIGVSLELDKSDVVGESKGSVVAESGVLDPLSDVEILTVHGVRVVVAEVGGVNSSEAVSGGKNPLITDQYTSAVVQTEAEEVESERYLPWVGVRGGLVSSDDPGSSDTTDGDSLPSQNGGTTRSSSR